MHIFWQYDVHKWLLCFQSFVIIFFLKIGSYILPFKGVIFDTFSSFLFFNSILEDLSFTVNMFTFCESCSQFKRIPNYLKQGAVLTV